MNGLFAADYLADPSERQSGEFGYPPIRQTLGRRFADDRVSTCERHVDSTGRPAEFRVHLVTWGAVLADVSDGGVCACEPGTRSVERGSGDVDERGPRFGPALDAGCVADGLAVAVDTDAVALAVGGNRHACSVLHTEGGVK
jgi:hypothetical protein